MKLSRESPKEALEVIASLVQRAGDYELVEDIGAGPLENLIREHGLLLIDDIEARAQADHRFRLAVSHVWIEEADSVIGLRYLALGCKPPGVPGDTDA